MCGRYALSMRPAQYRQRLADQNMPADEAPADEQVRQTYNFAPGSHGLIYRAINPSQDSNGSANDNNEGSNHNNEEEDSGEPPSKRAKTGHTTSSAPAVDGRATKETKYKLQAAKWGLIPFWTKRAPDYSSQMRTINCRDDSLIENRGMWNTMKQRKRCVVVAEGFYEWLKKGPGGKEKVPHFVKRSDGELMCFAGLYDSVRYEGSEETLWTYTVITTDSNAQLKFLHDRMPVILEAGSEKMKLWLDPDSVGWSKELQSILKPFEGELECYAVDKGVGKVGNNSPQFVIPVDSKENKNNIANFFGGSQPAKSPVKTQESKEEKAEKVKAEDVKIKHEPEETRETDAKISSTEDNAPLPKLASTSSQDLENAINRDTSAIPDEALEDTADEITYREPKAESSLIDDEALARAIDARPTPSPAKKAPPLEKTPSIGSQVRKMRSSTTNGTAAKTPTKGGDKKITSFFGK
jgi:putative SOS response-associated peptidase YedK